MPGDSSCGRRAFRVAIIGGGLAGIALAVGLLKHPHIDARIFEAAPSFGELGAAVLCDPNAQKALELLGRETEEALMRHATWNSSPQYANVRFRHLIVSIVEDLYMKLIISRELGLRKGNLILDSIVARDFER
jgi:2-polyprenyl-6-methoxyphenol hydroxylase-like FAD-dependent oxidoreductase